MDLAAWTSIKFCARAVAALFFRLSLNILCITPSPVASYLPHVYWHHKNRYSICINTYSKFPFLELKHCIIHYPPSNFDSMRIRVLYLGETFIVIINLVGSVGLSHYHMYAAMCRQQVTKFTMSIDTNFCYSVPWI